MRSNTSSGGSLRLPTPSWQTPSTAANFFGGGGRRPQRAVTEGCTLGQMPTWRHRSINSSPLSASLTFFATAVKKTSMCSESSMESNFSSSTTNLVRMRSCLGHSDPQISASSTFSSSPNASNRSTVFFSSVQRK
ncbi:unnamed protein product [Caenorhabditis auriculariae]|uniref:Uncharacterized protein n=1 Tax=Caenorhabditis auriculariae TaxID=2777116 RepID=A0A8S1HCL0_9PELO|nr:unnamed protein product [Caenorhabditis auriculariae]